jgi:hypothetical protein
MLFSILSVILIWIISSIVVTNLIIQEVSSTSIDNKLIGYAEASMGIAAIITLLFMWIMS